jgi:hypothetical protein
MQSSFFLPGIVPDVARIVHSFAARFLEPFVQFILVLIESVATKDIPPRKRGWGRFPAMLEDDSVSQVDDGVPIPGGGEGSRGDNRSDSAVLSGSSYWPRNCALVGH